MKKIIFFVILLCLCSSFIYAQWEACNNGLGGEYINSIAISGKNIFVGTENGVLLSTDNGISWLLKDSGLTNTIVQSLAISGNNIFAGTCFGGVFLSTDNGNSWSVKNDGLTNLFIRSFAIIGGYIFVGTDTSGIFRAKLSDFGIEDVEEVQNLINNFSISPNPASDLLFVQQAQDINSKYEIINLLGIKVLSGEIQGRSKSINIAQLPQGLYFIRIGNETKKFIKD
jgi:hypothetical protein